MNIPKGNFIGETTTYLLAEPIHKGFQSFTRDICRDINGWSDVLTVVFRNKLNDDVRRWLGCLFFWFLDTVVYLLAFGWRE